MVAATIVRVEVERPSGPLRRWEDALSAHIGQVDPRLREQEAVHCLPMDERPFAGRIEYGELGEMLLCKVAATNYRFTRSLTTPTPTLPIADDARFGLQRELSHSSNAAALAF